MDRASNPVPRYALFGESTGAAFEDMVHCETIEARSSRYEWEITPHRHPSLYQLLLVLDGSVDLMMNGHHTHLEKAVLLLFPPGTVHGFLQMTRDVAIARTAVGEVSRAIARWTR